MNDAQIRSEIRAQIAAQHLPAPNKDSIYFVFTPPHVIVVDQYGYNSANDFSAYNDYAPGSDGFAYVVVPYDDSLQDPRLLTLYASGTLAAAVTDPEPTSKKTLGWYDDNYGEIEAIPQALFYANQISSADLVDTLGAPDGTSYLVAKVWSNQAGAPVAFAATAGRPENMSRPLGWVQIQPPKAAAVGEGVRAAAQLAPSMPAGTLQLGLTADQLAYAPGEPVVLTLTATNPGSAPVTLDFPSSLQYDFEVRLGERTLWRWSAERAFSQALTQRTLGPGEQWVVTATWDGRDDQGQSLAPGSYQIVARLTSPANPLTATLPLWIGD